MRAASALSERYRTPARPFVARCAGVWGLGFSRRDINQVIMLRGAGYEVIDLGADVAADKFVDTAEAEGAQVIGLSALLTTTMPEMENVINLHLRHGGGNR